MRFKRIEKFTRALSKDLLPTQQGVREVKVGDYQQVRKGETCDTEQSAGRTAARSTEALYDEVPRLEKTVYIRGVVVEPDNV